MTFIAHSVQSLDFRFGITLRLLSHAQASSILAPHTIHPSPIRLPSHVRVYRGANDMEKRIIGQHIRELVLWLKRRGGKTLRDFSSYDQSIEPLDNPDVDAVLLKLCFQLRLTALVGFIPFVSRESVEK